MRTWIFADGILTRWAERTRWASLLFGAVIATVCAGCGEPWDDISRPSHIVLICVDTLRPDHLSGYGYERPTTPNLDELAATEGVVFEHAYASSSWTLPSVMSVMTSLHAPQHGVEDRGSRLSDQASSLPERLSGDGWHTAAFVTHIYVSSLFGFDRGFAEFHELSIKWDFKEGHQLRANKVNQRVLPWLNVHAESPSFLYLHYFDPHWNYSPPGPYRSRFTDPDYDGPADGTWNHLNQYLPRDQLMPPADLAQTVGLYDGEILWTDHQLGRVFGRMKTLGIWNEALVVIFGDHGEEFQEHGSVHHVRTLYEEVLRVPLIVKLPGGRPATARPRVAERVRLVDIAPTILAVAGSPDWPGIAGRNLLPLIFEPGVDRDIFAHTVRHKANRMALMTGKWKLILTYKTAGKSIELFDLAADPLERVSLAEERPDVAGELVEKTWREFVSMRLWNRDRLSRGEPVVLSTEQEEQLRRLGYIE